jgi:tetraacyldisaccharide 4'-kinase
MLNGQRVVAFCGIGNPAGFRHTLAGSGCQIAAWRDFPDHHAYCAGDIAELHRLAASCRADMIVCTQKDLVKLPANAGSDCPVWALAIELQFLAGEELLESALQGTTRDIDRSL